MNLKNLKILDKTPHKGVEEGTILEEIRNDHGVLAHVNAKFPSGTRTVALLALESGKVLVPEDQIPDKWKRVIEAHPELAVFYTKPHLDTSGTSLVHRGNLGVLTSRIESIEYADLELDEAGVFQEGKPELDSCETIYRCGGVEIGLPEEPERW